MTQPTLPPGTAPISSPLESIRNAFGTFIAAFRFYEACLNRRFEPEWFGNRRVRLFTGDGDDPDERPGLTIAPQVYSHDDLATAAHNLLFAAMGNMASTIYETVATDMGLRDTNKDVADYTDTDKAIEILYQIRNGFAHRPHSPDWRVNNPRRRNHYVLTLEGITIDIDFANLNGSSISPSHFGGYEGFVALCQHLGTVATGLAP